MAAGDLAYDATANMMLSALTGANKSKVTTTSGISQEGMNSMLQQILQSTQGLAQVSSGQKSAGMYNSTVNTQMVNDLLTRATGEVQAQNKTTTQTTKGGNGLSGILQMMALSYGKKGLGTLWDKSGLGAEAGAIYDYATGATSVSPVATTSANLSADPIGALIESQGWSATASDSMATAALSDTPTATVSSAGAVAGGGELTDAGYAAVTSGAAGDSAALWEGADMAASGSSTVGAAASGTSEAATVYDSAEAYNAASASSSTAGTATGSTASTAGNVAGYAAAAYNVYEGRNKYQQRDDTSGEIGVYAGTAIGGWFGGATGAAIGSAVGGPIGSAVGHILAGVDDAILQPLEHGISNIGSEIGDIFGW